MADSEPNGFFDLQLNGYAEVDFNADGLTGNRLHAACRRLQADGVSGVLATIVTDDIEAMAGRLAALVAARETDELSRRIIAGVHIEGPFLNETEGYRGAHLEGAIRPADADAMKRLLEAAGGLARVVTLAPERDEGLKVTRMLADAGIVVSAGHCKATMEQLIAALDAGLSMFTHLGNGCPAELPRHDNIIQRVLSLRGRLWIAFIADGHHIPTPALGNYLRAAGLDRTFIITDGTATSGSDLTYHQMGRWKVPLGPDRVAREPGGKYLLGSTATMRQCYETLVEKVGLSDDDARRLTVGNPRKAVGLA
ncbi:MAG TPA: N-acetylglucosamine-6-phosphate deacetylase [Phycisphaerae bacterium]|nr:N-acetylglucosamine-6-phosphate deacetylase [Phycisphaerae bacterium]